MAVTQTMTFTATPPILGVDSKAVFVEKAEACWAELKDNVVPDLNVAFGQINSTETNINNKEASAVSAASTATTKASEASASASAASASASAASASASAAASSEATVETLVSYYSNNVYIRSVSAPASTEALWFDTTINLLKMWNGAAWVPAGTTVNGMYNRSTFTATQGQAIFNAIYDVDSVVVYRNGTMLPTSDFTAQDGLNIVLLTGANVGDIIDIIGFGAINAENMYNKTEVNGLLATKQDVLVSGTNIKTINSSSILGSGNLTIEGFTLAQAQATALCF